MLTAVIKMMHSIHVDPSYDIINPIHEMLMDP